MATNLFSDALAQFRELAGLTQLQLATRSGCAHSSVNRWENGGTLPKKDNVDRLDEALSANGKLLTAWRRAATGTGLPEWARDLDAIERGARQVSLAAPALVPGYLQCEEYARAVFSAGYPMASTEELDRLVELRCDRLIQLDDLRVSAVFPVSAVAGVPDDVCRAQATHLIKWVETDRVAVHLAPEGTTLLVPTSPLMIFKLRSGDLVAASDHATGNVVHEPAMNDQVTTWFMSALAASLPVKQSVELLRTLS